MDEGKITLSIRHRFCKSCKYSIINIKKEFKYYRVIVQ